MEKKTTDLQLKVQKAILDDSRTKEHGIETLDDNGVITLKGKVPSHEISQMAETIAENVQGVAGVINALKVQKSEQEIAV
jgi:osmotically-inducible protein OsmY